MEKKTNIFCNKEWLESQTNHFLETVQEHCKNKSTLVYINNDIVIPIDRYIRWKELEPLAKQLLVYLYAQESGFYAITCDFSVGFADKIHNVSKQEDFIRRRLNENFKNNIGKIPLYAFCVDISKKQYLHIHGIIIGDVNEKILKDIFKRTLFGKNYRINSMKNFEVKLIPMNDGSKWLSYVFKRYYSEPNAFSFYCSRNLNRLIQQFYEKARQQMKGVK